MSEAIEPRTDPERTRLIRSCFEWSDLWQVADAMTVATGRRSCSTSSASTAAIAGPWWPSPRTRYFGLPLGF